MNVPKSGKLYYVLAGGALVLTVGMLYLQKGGLDDLNEQVTQLRDTAQKQKGASQKLADAQKELTGLQTQLSHLEQGIPDAAYVPTMLRELEALGKSDNVEVGGLRPAAKHPEINVPGVDKKPMAAKPYDTVDLELKGKAKYSDLLKFVTALNTFPKILEVRTVNITPSVSNGLSTDDRLDVTMGIRAFLFKTTPDQQKKVGAT